MHFSLMRYQTRLFTADGNKAITSEFIKLLFEKKERIEMQN